MVGLTSYCSQAVLSQSSSSLPFESLESESLHRLCPVRALGFTLTIKASGASLGCYLFAKVAVAGELLVLFTSGNFLGHSTKVVVFPQALLRRVCCGRHSA